MKKVLSLLLVTFLLFTSGMPAYAIESGYNLDIVVNSGYDLYIDATASDGHPVASEHNHFPNVDSYDIANLSSDSVIAAKAFDRDNSSGIIAGFYLAYDPDDGPISGSSNDWYVYSEQKQPPKGEDGNKWYTKDYRVDNVQMNKWIPVTEIDPSHFPDEGWQW